MIAQMNRIIHGRAPESGGCRTLRAALAILLIVPLAAGSIGGCGSGNSTIDKPKSASVSSSESAYGLTLTLSQNASTIGVGQSVKYTLTVTNTSNSPVTYVPEYSDNVSVVIAGTYSYVTVTNTADASQLLFPGAVELGTGLSEVGSPVTLAPGATLTGTISSGEISQPAVYSATATVYIAVDTSGSNAYPGFNALLTAGPLALTVR